ncbi:MAG: peptidoglycan DD-metalloendopeptidase family protein [Spirochaetes bacterium]|nr:peptidoglycan DD-metalloendopeptidase family protein [Spirochaetota bacterium]
MQTLRLLLAKIAYYIEYAAVKLRFSIRYQRYRLERRNIRIPSFSFLKRPVVILTLLIITTVLLFAFFPHPQSAAADAETLQNAEDNFQTQQGNKVNTADIIDMGVDTSLKPAAHATGVVFTDYTVQKGDSIWSIAKDHALALDTIIGVNNIKDLNALTIGSVIKLPNMNGINYTVRANDTLSHISLFSGSPIEKIKEMNGITDASIAAGRVLFLPDGKLDAVERNRLFGIDFNKPIYGRLTSRYGLRKHPFLGYRMFHTGVDIGYNNGGSVRAVQAGTVGFAGENGGYGNYVSLQHKNGFTTAYGHLASISVAPGAYVKKGDVIGVVGSTGISTGPHLHFEVLYRGKYVNPLSYVRY